MAKYGECIEGHSPANDLGLLAPPPTPLSHLEMFVCTYGARATSLQTPHERLISILIESVKTAPETAIKALNCNYGHWCQEGYERFLKCPKYKLEKNSPPGRRQRKGEGDRTCFNSAIETIIVPDENNTDPEFMRKIAEIKYSNPIHKEPKFYHLKYFPTTGQIQVAGLIIPPQSKIENDRRVFQGEFPEDGSRVVRLWVDFINTQDITDKTVVIINEDIKMLNFKFHMRRRSPRIILDQRRVAAILDQTQALSKYELREIKPPGDDAKVSVKFVTHSHEDNKQTKKVRLNIFQEGKINILGAKSFIEAEYIYNYIYEVFQKFWDILTCLRPIPDAQRNGLKPTPPLPPVCFGRTLLGIQKHRNAFVLPLEGSTIIPQTIQDLDMIWAYEDPYLDEIETFMHSFSAYSQNIGLDEIDTKYKK